MHRHNATGRRSYRVSDPVLVRLPLLRLQLVVRVCRFWIGGSGDRLISSPEEVEGVFLDLSRISLVSGWIRSAQPTGLCGGRLLCGYGNGQSGECFVGLSFSN